MIIRDCKTYEIWEDDIMAGKFYYGQDHSFIELAGRNAVIESNRRLSWKPVFRLYDQATKNCIGNYEFSLWQPVGKLQCVLRLENGIVYFFIENTDHRRVFKPGTWGLEQFDMAGGAVEISYFGRISGQFVGEIVCNKTDCLFEIMAGLFVIEEKFRYRENDAG